MGRVFKRGSVYWIAYSYRNQEYRESAHSESEAAARKLLKKRIGEAGTGQFIGPNEERVTFEYIADALLTDYEINKLRSVRSVKLSIKHLRRTFGMQRALDITTDKIKKYIAERQREDAANANINFELSALKRMFKLAIESGRLRFGPHIPMLEENNARQGFVDHGVFLALRERLPRLPQRSDHFPVSIRLAVGRDEDLGMARCRHRRPGRASATSHQQEQGRPSSSAVW